MPLFGEGEEAHVEQVDFQTVFSHRTKRLAQPAKGELFKQYAQSQTEGDGSKEEEVAEREKPVFCISKQVESACTEGTQPENEMGKCNFSVLMDETPQQKAEEKDGNTVENIHQPPPAVPNENLTEKKGERNGGSGNQNGAFYPS